MTSDRRPVTAAMNDDNHALSQFTGRARLFPLPNLVLFPHVVQPLHVFEPRYRRMTARALAGDRLIALVLLKPGWEADYDHRPGVHAVGCLGRIAAEQRLDDGRYNLLMRGLSRIRIRGELADDEPYRTARAELLPDETPSHVEAGRLRRDLGEQVLPRFRGQSQTQLKELFAGELPLGALADILSFAMPFSVAEKQELLDETDVASRVIRLAALIDGLAAPAAPSARKFPPDFSAN